MTPAARRARVVPFVAAVVLWLVYVLVAAFTTWLGRGMPALFATVAWHALTGYAATRAMPPRDVAPEGRRFAMTRNAILATVVSLLTASVAVFLIRGGGGVV